MSTTIARNGVIDEQEAKASAFFSACPIDPSLEATEKQLSDFLQHNRRADGAPGLRRPLVVVTSGGTTVPLERRCVRFIDNFSAGTRGALSVEQFLQQGYAVVFLRRKGSIEPFTQQLPGSVLGLLTHCLQLGESGNGSPVQQQAAQICPQYQPALTANLRAASNALATHSLLHVEFETIFEYLQLLQAVAQAVAPFGSQVLFYLAAAVSDFYVPWDKLEEHKIQSADGDLQLALSKVPKVLGVLVNRWAPASIVVSFKLETDEHILVSKAVAALTNYGVHAVVANLLHNRKDQVLIVTPHAAELDGGVAGSGLDSAGGGAAQAQGGGVQTLGKEVQQQGAGSRVARPDDVAVTTITRPPGDVVIERVLVAHVVALHAALQRLRHT